MPVASCSKHLRLHSLFLASPRMNLMISAGRSTRWLLPTPGVIQMPGNKEIGASTRYSPPTRRSASARPSSAPSMPVSVIVVSSFKRFHTREKWPRLSMQPSLPLAVNGILMQQWNCSPATSLVQPLLSSPRLSLNMNRRQCAQHSDSSQEKRTPHPQLKGDEVASWLHAPMPAEPAVPDTQISRDEEENKEDEQ